MIFKKSIVLICRVALKNDHSASALSSNHPLGGLVITAFLPRIFKENAGFTVLKEWSPLPTSWNVWRWFCVGSDWILSRNNIKSADLSSKNKTIFTGLVCIWVLSVNSSSGYGGLCYKRWGWKSQNAGFWVIMWGKLKRVCAAVRTFVTKKIINSRKVLANSFHYLSKPPIKAKL